MKSCDVQYLLFYNCEKVKLFSSQRFFQCLLMHNMYLMASDRVEQGVLYLQFKAVWLSDDLNRWFKETYFAKQESSKSGWGSAAGQTHNLHPEEQGPIWKQVPSVIP